MSRPLASARALVAGGALLVAGAGCRAPTGSPRDARPAGVERWGTLALIAPDSPRPWMGAGSSPMVAGSAAKPDETKAEAPEAEAPEQDAPQADPPQADEPKADEPSDDAPDAAPSAAAAQGAAALEKWADKEAAIHAAQDAEPNPEAATGAPAQGGQAATPAGGAAATAPAAADDAPVAEDPEVAAAAAKPPSKLSGSLSSVYFGRFTDGESDHDLHEVLSVDYGDPESDRWSAHAVARLAADLDGGADGPDPFFELDDAHEGSVDERLYDAWVQHRTEGEVERLRFGRQTLWDTPAIAWFDGLLAETRELGEQRIEVGAYAGLPVHQHEASSPSGDLIAGLYGTARPWTGARARVDFMHLDDETSQFEADDDLVGLSLWQDVGRGVQLDGRYTRVGSDDRDLRIAATWSKPDDDLVVQLSWFRLLETQVFRALEIDPFSPTLMELEPYDQGRLLVSKQFGERLGIQTGFDLRRVDAQEDIGEFNRDFDRGFLTATLDETLPAELVLAMTGEVWDSDGNDIRTWGADLSREFGNYLASLGSYYQLYKIDLFDADEREDVRTWFLRLRHRAKGASFSWDVSYEYEDGDLDPFHTLRVGATWFF